MFRGLWNRVHRLEGRFRHGWTWRPARLQVPPGRNWTFGPPIDPNVPRLEIPEYDARYGPDGSPRTDIHNIDM